MPEPHLPGGSIQEDKNNNDNNDNDSVSSNIIINDENKKVREALPAKPDKKRCHFHGYCHCYCCFPPPHVFCCCYRYW